MLSVSTPYWDALPQDDGCLGQRTVTHNTPLLPTCNTRPTLHRDAEQLLQNVNHSVCVSHRNTYTYTLQCVTHNWTSKLTQLLMCFSGLAHPDCQLCCFIGHNPLPWYTKPHQFQFFSLLRRGRLSPTNQTKHHVKKKKSSVQLWV